MFVTPCQVGDLIGMGNLMLGTVQRVGGVCSMLCVFNAVQCVCTCGSSTHCVCVSVCLCVCVFGVYVSVTAVAGSLVPRPPRPAFVLQATKAGRGGLGTRLCSGCYRSFQIQCKVIPSKPPIQVSADSAVVA